MLGSSTSGQLPVLAPVQVSRNSQKTSELGDIYGIQQRAILNQIFDRDQRSPIGNDLKTGIRRMPTGGQGKQIKVNLSPFRSKQPSSVV